MTTPSRCTGVAAAARTQGKRAQHGKPQSAVRDDQPEAREGQAGRSGVAERLVVPLKPGNAGGGKGPQFKTNAASSEGPEIGKPSNSKKCSETADSVTRESEGRSRLSLLRPVRQDQPRRYSGACLCPVPLQQGRTGGGRPGLRGYRGIRGRTMAGGTGACAQAGDLPAGANQTSVYTEGQRQTQAAGHLDRARSGLHDGSDAGAGADLRSRPSTRNLRLPRRAQRPAGRRSGGGAAVPWPSGS